MIDSLKTGTTGAEASAWLAFEFVFKRYAAKAALIVALASIFALALIH